MTTLRASVLIVAGAVLVTGGWLAAQAANRPLNVRLRTHVEFYQQTEGGAWELIDEAGPATLNFNASLREMANGKRIGSDFEWTTRTKNGRQYSVHLADPADVDWNPATGRFDGTLNLEVTLDGQSANVVAEVTTGSITGPTRGRSGNRMRGVPGMGVSTLTLVSSNLLELPGEAPIRLVATEEYRLAPGQARE